MKFRLNVKIYLPAFAQTETEMHRRHKECYNQTNQPVDNITKLMTKCTEHLFTFCFKEN